MALQIRRGLQSALPASPAEGELLYATDTGNLYIGVSGTPTIVNSGGGGGGATAISDLTDVYNISGITNGQALLWNATNSRFEAGSIPAGYADSDVQTFLGGGTLAGHIIPATDVTYDLGSSTNKFRDLFLSGSTITLGTTTISVTGGGDLDIAGTTIPNAATGNIATESYVTTAIDALVDSSPGALDTLNELAAALGDDANFSTTVTDSIALKANSASLATVATSGLFTDLTSRPTIALSGNNLSYDGTTIDLTSVGATGPQGATGAAGADGAAGSDGATGATGPQGATGPAGPAGTNGTNGTDGADGADGADSTVAGPTGATGPAGAAGAAGADGADGADGAAGVGITATALVGDNLTLTYSNTSVQDIGSVRGPTGSTGPAGADGTSISTAAISGATLTLTMSDASTINVSGNVVGATGATGPQGPTGAAGADGSNGADGSDGATGATGPAGSNGTNGSDGADGADGADGVQLTDFNAVTISASGTGAFAYNSGTGVFTYTPPDLSSFITSETDSQTLGLSGNTLSITGGNSVDLSSVGGASAFNDLSDVSTSGATSGQVLKYNGASWAPAADSTGSGGIASLAADTTPQLGGHLDVNGQDIVTTSGADIDLNPDTTGEVVFRGNATRGSGSFKLNCENNSHGITLKGPAHSAAANYTLTFPTTDGDTNQVLTTDGSGGLSWSTPAGGGGGGGNAFTNFVVSGQNTIQADTATDTLTIAAGSGVTLTTDSGTDTLTIAASGGGGGGATVERFKLNYNTSGSLTTTSDLTSGITSATISGDDVTITFGSGYSYPPASVMIYGYDYNNNKYYLSNLETTMGTREIAGGGASGSPTAFGASAPAITLKLSETVTGASRFFGSVTHAWIQMVVHG